MKAFTCVTGPWYIMHPWLVLFVMEPRRTRVKRTCTRRAYVHNLCVGLSDCEMNRPWTQTRCPLWPPPSCPHGSYKHAR